MTEEIVGTTYRSDVTATLTTVTAVQAVTRQRGLGVWITLKVGSDAVNVLLSGSVAKKLANDILYKLKGREEKRGDNEPDAVAPTRRRAITPDEGR
jgi:hypothetical protein